jgi:hypothetical protein
VTDATSSEKSAARKPRRQRSLTENLLSIVLGLEAVLVFFIALTVFGLHALPPLEAFGGGALLAILLGIGTRFVRYGWGVWYGWAMQVALLATGIVLPALYIAAAFFLALWIFCFVRARQLEGSGAARSSSTTPTEGEPKK